MLKLNKIVFSLFFISAFGCKNFEPLVLDDSNQLALEEPAEVGIPAETYQDGMLFNFAGPINMWWKANDKLSIEKVGDTLRVDLKDCGQKYECWGTELSELLDFTNAPVLKVTARVENSRMIPMVGISLKDMDGNDTNLDRPSQRIQKSDNYQEYYFNFTGKWKQIWPMKADVNPASIAEILFFVNPGQMNWTGTIYIDDIQVITLDQMPDEEELKRRREARLKARGIIPAKPETTEPKEDPKAVIQPKAEVEPAVAPENTSDVAPKVDSTTIVPTTTRDIIVADAEGKVIDDFNGPVKSWWTSSDSKIKLSKVEEGKMQVELNGVGPAFETFGKVFSHIDFTKTPVVKVRFKAESDQVGDLRIDIKDAQGFSTNSKPNVKLFQTGTDFVDFYYDFTGKFQQTFPNTQRVTPEEIVEVILFVNPGGKPFNGKIILEEITTISLEDFNKVKN